MKVLFIQKDGFIKIGLMVLSSVLKKNGHDCELAVEVVEPDLKGVVARYSPDLIGFSCTTGMQDWTVRVATELKKDFDIPIIVGGPHPTFFPEMIREPAIDYICVGEGEGAILELLEALENGVPTEGVKNIATMKGSGIAMNPVRSFIEDLDTIPFSDFGLYSKYGFLMLHYCDMYPTITGRGCPKKCSYCFNDQYKEIYKNKGRYLRQRSPQHVIEELVAVKQKYKIKKVNFVDDAFLIQPRWIAEFSPLYREKVGLPCIVNVEATYVKEDGVRLLKEMGCIGVRMGVETGNEHLRMHVLNKKISNDQLLKAASLVKKYGLKLTTYNMMGIPGEKIEQALETLTLNRKMGTDFAQCSILQPYPGTQLSRYANKLRILEGEGGGVYELNESFFDTSKIKIDDEREIINLQKFLQIFIYLKVPMFLVRRIIRLPKLKVFNALFKLSYAFSKIQTNGNGWIPTIVMGLKSKAYR